MHGGDPGVGLGGAPEERQGFVGPALADPQSPELDQGAHAVPILAQRPLVLRDRLARAACPLQGPSLLEQDLS
jgi:hypothetical protein